MSGDCAPDPKFSASRRGYEDAVFVTPSVFPAVDWTLRPFDLVQQVTTVAASASWGVVCAVALPVAQYGMLTHFGQDANAAGTFQTTQWRIRVNNGIIGNIFPALVQVAGITAATLCPFQCFLPPGATVTLEALNSANPGEVVRGRLKGYTRIQGNVSP